MSRRAPKFELASFANRTLLAMTAWITRDRGIAGEVTALAAANLASQVVAVSAVLVLTRLYSPADFGVYAAALSVVSIILVTGCLRFEQAIPIAESRSQAAGLIVLSSIVGAVVLVIAGAALLLLEPAIRGALGLQSLAPFIGLILLAGAGGIMGVVLHGWAVRTRAFTDLAQARVSAALGLVVAQVGLGLWGAGATRLLLGDALGRAIGTVRLARRLWREEGAWIRGVRLSSLPGLADRYRRFPIFSGPSALLNVVNQQVPTVAVVAMFGSAVAGTFMLAIRVVNLPNGLALAAIAPVFVAESARLRHDHEALRQLFDKTARRLLLLGVGPATLIVIAAPTISPVVFGEEWSDAGIYAALLAPMALVQLVSAPMSGILSVIERQDLHLAREIVTVVLLMVVVTLSAANEWTAVPTVAAFSAVGTVSAVGYFTAMRHAIGAVGSTGAPPDPPRIDRVP